MFSACGVVTICDVGFVSPLNQILDGLTNSFLIASSKIADGFNCIHLKKNKKNIFLIILDYLLISTLRVGQRKLTPFVNLLHAHMFAYLTFNL